jgi:hypothetical protein
MATALAVRFLASISMWSLINLNPWHHAIHHTFTRNYPPGSQP